MKKGRGVQSPRPQLIEKTCEMFPPLVRSLISSKIRLRAKELARGLGRSPKWVRKAKQR